MTSYSNKYILAKRVIKQEYGIKYGKEDTVRVSGLIYRQYRPEFDYSKILQVQCYYWEQKECAY